MIADAEAAFIREGVACNVRADGRTRDELRAMRVTPRVTPLANGSARVRIGVLGVPGEYTDVIVAVKAELLPTTPNTQTGDFLHFGAQVQTASGDAGDAEALEIAQAMARLIGSACSAEDSPVAAQLAVSRVVHWELYIDAVVMECGGGNVFDAVALATRAALAATKLPLLDIVEGEVPGTYDVELASDVTKLAPEHAPKNEDDEDLCTLADSTVLVPFDASAVPLCVTVARIGEHYVVDPSAAEERVMGARLLVGVTPRGTVCGLHKTGRGALPPSTLGGMVAVAQATAERLFTALDDGMRA